MVAGHLREKSGYYYAVLNYTDPLGKRKTKWISTGLTIKGNKKKAEAVLMDARRNFVPETPKVMSGDIMFADFMEKWLEVIKSSVAVPTFASYSTSVKKIIAPYFREKEITLKNLTAKDIQEFYLKELERVSASSVIHYHANIRSKYRRSQPASESCGGRLPPVLTLRWTARWCRIRCKGRRIGGKTRPVKEYIAAPIDFSFFLI